MSFRVIETSPLKEVAAHPETIEAVGLDRAELLDELVLMRFWISFGRPLLEDPSLPVGEIHVRPRSTAGLTRRPMTISKAPRKPTP